MIRKRYDKASRVGIDLGGESRTKQQFKDETDINKIMARYVKTGQLSHLVKKNPIYGDFSSVPDYMSAVALVERAEIAFAALPASVRADCENDPAQFLARVSDPAFVETHKDALRGVVSIPSDPKPTPPSQPAANPAAAGGASG